MKSGLLKNISSTVLMLGLVSLFTDISSEMIYPLLPVFLTQVLGAGAFSIGLIEGVAESTSALLRIFSGAWADRMPKRKPIVIAGYAIAGIARPLIGAAGSWPMVLFLRFSDRVGKGIRSPARDALIADSTPVEARGAAFGFHQAMDHAGSVIGPLVASALMVWLALSMRSVFLLAAVPAALAVAVLIWGVREPDVATAAGKSPPRWSEAGDLTRRMGLLFASILLFTLGNSTDAFLLIKLNQAGLAPGFVAVLWSVHHVIKMSANVIGGRWTDRFGAKPMIIAGWTVYAGVYLGFAMFSSLHASVVLFLMYGIYFGLTEPSQKALVSYYAPARLRGTAFGLYNFVIGIGALPASLLFGWVWQSFGAPHAFGMGAALAFAAAVMLLWVRGPGGDDQAAHSA
jgi:MFS family permease